jgi:hypothetical protein
VELSLMSCGPHQPISQSLADPVLHPIRAQQRHWLAMA